MFTERCAVQIIEAEIQSTFKALADPTRRHILKRLGDRDMSIGELAQGFEMTRAAVKKHLNVLEQGGLISVRPNGRERINTLEPDRLMAASNWINYFSGFWDNRLNNLKTAIENED